MYALQLKYINNFGDAVFRHIPLFDTEYECSWWAEWFTGMLKSDHATSIVAACMAIAS